MVNQLVKWTIIVGLWRKYKRHGVATLALLAALLLIHYLHLDFVEYAQVTGSTHIGVSYALKWLTFVAAFAVYLWQVKKLNQQARYDSRLHKMMQNKRKDKTDSGKEDKAQGSEPAGKGNADPFAAIRTKKTLRSEADFLINKDK